ncbi:hypothetical protein [Niabella sp.]|uniref:hypothetical protein n=1 Tax=Niabella sp. TaxID=1962976 RepID=UPI00261CA9E8|nr:hypothetical protein [Niabella sp.]
MKKIIITVAAFFSLCNVSDAQDEKYDPQTEKINLGVGMGFDYGGLGANLLVYPQKNIGVFAGGGYALAGFGYNVGVKGRFFLKEGSAVSPFLMGMYGYHTAIRVENNTALNKLFYGPTFAAGIDWRVGRLRKNYLSIALTVPVRNGDEKTYRDALVNNHGAQFENDFLPVGLSLGYRLRLK